jgi:hypothetical protein
MTRTTKEKANTMVRNPGSRRRLIGPRSAAVGVAALSAATVLGLTSLAGAAPAPTGGGASGSVASVSGSTMEVQSTSDQTSVSWTAATTFSETATETISDVAVGDCLTVTGTPAKKSKTTIAARSVAISKPSTSGACTAGSRAGAGFGGAGGGQGRFGAGGTGSGSSGTPPRGSFPGRGSGGGGAGGRPSFAGGANFAVATGKVTAVKGSTLSVSGTLLNQLFNRAAKKPTSKTTKKPGALKTQNLKVTTGKSTTLSETVSATSAAVAVGECVSAFGKPSSTGAVAATTVRITSTGGKTCSSGFGGGFGGGGQGGASGA